MRRIALAAGVLLALLFALQGGEYGTTDLMRQHTRRADLTRAIDSLEQVVDSLSRVRRALATDAALQERIAREEFGMVRGEKEILYRFAEPRDSARSKP